jgi:hypothetical protein
MGAAPVIYIPSGAPVEMHDMSTVGAPDGYLTASVGGANRAWPSWSP